MAVFDESTSIEQLEKLVEYHNYQYWVLNSPKISDEEFDLLVERLRLLDPASIVLTRIGPAGAGDNGVKAEAGSKVVHDVPMLSLDKCYSDEAFSDWIDGVFKIGRSGGFVAASGTGLRVAVSPKVDGVAASLRYGSSGVFELAATRGDGREGEDFTINARLIGGVPLKVSTGRMEVRGEVYMPASVFRERYASLFSNPRNLAAGSLKQKEGNRAQILDLRFAAYDVMVEGQELSELDKYQLLKAEGFDPVQAQWMDWTEVGAAYRRALSERADWPFEADGIVVKIDDPSLAAAMGATEHHRRSAIAYKFQGDSGYTTLLAVEWNVSRTGAITPVALVSPVVLSGAAIERCSLHNISILRAHGLKIGDKVLVTRRGGVIPNLELSSGGGDKDVTLPERCPSCGSPTVLAAPQVFAAGLRVSECTALSESVAENRNQWALLWEQTVPVPPNLSQWDRVVYCTNWVATGPSTSKAGVAGGGVDSRYKDALTWSRRAKPVARRDLFADSTDNDAEDGQEVRRFLSSCPRLLPPKARWFVLAVIDLLSPNAPSQIAGLARQCVERGDVGLVVVPMWGSRYEANIDIAATESWKAGAGGRFWSWVSREGGLVVDSAIGTSNGRFIPDFRRVAQDKGYELGEAILSCSRPQQCRGARLGKLEYFAKVMGIDGFGPEILAKAYNAGLLETRDQFFRLKASQLVTLDRMGDRLALRLIDNIRASSTTTLARFLESLGIFELAGRNSRLLAETCGSLDAVLSLTVADLTSSRFPEIGLITAVLIVEGLKQEAEAITALAGCLVFENAQPAPVESTAGPLPLAGQSVVFTGELSAMGRKEAQALVRKFGGSTPSDVVAETTILVTGDEGTRGGARSSKLKKAEALAAKGRLVRILTEKEFWALLPENSL